MAKAPAFQFYARDWIADTRVLALEERGALIDLLAYAWLEEGIPDDPARLARILGASKREFTRLWPAVAPAWHPTGDGRLINRRQEDYRAELVAYRRERSESGARGVAARRPRINAALRSEVFEREGGRRGERVDIPCAYCPTVLTMDWTRVDRPRLVDVEGRSTPELDHVIPLAKEGPHEASNLVPSCLPCNRRKCAGDPPKPRS